MKMKLQPVKIIFINIYNFTVLSRFDFLISFENDIKLQSI